MIRSDNRTYDEHRPVKVTPNYIIHPEGSVLIECGNTKVICSATVDEDVPSFLKKSHTGWVTAEYSMLPRSTDSRMRRERNKVGGRTYEIQRLIGRSLRAVVDFKILGERTITVDCDVIQADGGTRTASITGGFIAMALAVEKLKKEKLLSKSPIKDYVGAISLGLVGGELLLDLEYAEDSAADVDMNLIMTGSEKLVEIQGTAEKEAFSKDQLNQMLDLGWRGIQSLIEIQRQIVKI